MYGEPWYEGFPGVKGALVPLPSALSGVSEILQDAGLRPWGEPRGEKQMPLWLLTILSCERQAVQRWRVNVVGTGEVRTPLIRCLLLDRCFRKKKKGCAGGSCVKLLKIGG